MTQKQLERSLDQAWNAYLAQIYDIAARARTENLLPYLEKTQRSFAAGMGTFVVDDTTEEQIPTRLLTLLNTGVPGLDRNSIGSLMNSYPEE
jgi:hypothetical protein